MTDSEERKVDEKEGSDALEEMDRGEDEKVGCMDGNEGEEDVPEQDEHDEEESAVRTMNVIDMILNTTETVLLFP